MQLIIFIGLQGAGKSTFYKERFIDTHIRLNGDMLKTAHREKLLFGACLDSKTPTVIDKTNPTRDVRADYIRLAKAHHFKVIAYYFDVPFDVALANNNGRHGKAKTPEVGLKSIAKVLTRPDFDEGFDKIFVVKNIGGDFEVQEYVCDLTN